MGFDFQNTSYSGADASAAQVEQLAHEPAAEFLTAVPQPDGHMVMQSRLPEWGHGDNGEFRLRANFNYFHRGVAVGCLNEQGQLDPAKANQWLDVFQEEMDALGTNGPLADSAAKRLADTFAVPAEHRAEFIRFLRDHDVYDMLNSLNGSLSNYSGLLTKLSTYQILMNGQNGNDPRPGVNETRDALVRENYTDFRNLEENLRWLAMCDPEAETRVMVPMDCSDYAKLNKNMMNLNNRWRDAHGLKPVTGNVQTLYFDLSREDRANGHYAAFNGHVCFVITYQPDGEEAQYVSVETTAPPAGKMLFCPSAVRTAVGVYPNVQALQDFHESRNIVTVPRFTQQTELVHEAGEQAETVTHYTTHPEMEAERQRNLLTTEERREWVKALRAIHKQLCGTTSSMSSDSPSFTALKKSLDQLMSNDGRALDGKSPEALTGVLEQVDTLAGEYLAHCKERPRTGFRRSERMDAAQTLRELYGMAGNGLRDPAAAYRDTLLDQFLQFAREYQVNRNESASYREKIAEMFNDPVLRARSKEQVANSPAFKALIGSGDVRTIHKLMKTPRQSYDTFLSLNKKMSTPDHIPQRERVAEPERATNDPAPGDR